MARNNKSVDGFVRRRDGSNLGSRAGQSSGNLSPQRGELHTGSDTAGDLSDKPKQSTIGTSGLQASLEAIDSGVPQVEETESRRRRRKRLRRERNKVSRSRRNAKRVLIVFLILVVGLLAYLGIRFAMTSNNIFQGGILDLIKNQPLKQDENGRSNFIIFGTAEDDENGTHGGALLTDSLMIVSINQEKKDAFMLSLPRDLWVDYGRACPAGYQGKINEVYNCGSSGGQNEEAGAKALQAMVQEVTGLDVQYYVHLNFTAVIDLVDAVGGVDVTIQSNPEGVGILDRNFDWKCGYRCYYVKYEDGERAHLDGEHALALARARNASGGYGLAGGNFDREKNQQKIAEALREKALSVGTLTSVSKVTKILDALGDNLRTNIQTKEVRTLVDIAKEIESSKIRSLTLVDKEAPLVTTGQVGNASVVLPTAGMFNYTAIKAYIQRESSLDPAVREGASVAVYNAGDVAGAAQEAAEKLEAKGYKIAVIADAPIEPINGTRVYRLSDGFSATTSELGKRYQTTAITDKTPPFGVGVAADFVVLLGKQAS